MRIILDTNVALSALLWRGKPYRLLEDIRQRSDIRLFSSPVLLAELADVLPRPSPTKQLAVIGRSAREVLADSQCMVAYYESPAVTPPANLLPQIAAALGVSIDDLFGVGTKRRLVKQDGDSRLRRRLLAIEKLAVAEKRQVLQVIDAFIERGQLKRKAESRA